MGRGRVLRACREVLLTGGALLGLAGIVLVLAGALFGVRPLLFRSGSMAPAIHTGDLAIARSVPATDLAPGDIVSVVSADGTRITHRLVGAADQGALRALTLKGDANRSPDAEVYPVARADKVLFHVPWAGYVVAAATSRVGVVVLGGYVGLLLFLLLGGRNADDPPPGPGTGRRGGRRRDGGHGQAGHRAAGHRTAGHRRAGASAVRTASVTVLSGLLALAGPASAAPWTDSVEISGTVLTADSMHAVTISCSGGGLLSSPTISWNAPTGPAPTSYLVTYANGGNVQTESTTATSWHLPGGLLSLLATYTVSVQTVRGNWRSPASNTTRISLTSVLFLGVIASCA